MNIEINIDTDVDVDEFRKVVSFVSKDILSYQIVDNIMILEIKENSDKERIEFLLTTMSKKYKKIIHEEDVEYFIFIGRLVKDKGVNELVRAFSQLNVQYPKTRLLLVGAYEEKLDPLSSETFFEINNNKNIEAVGPQKDVRPWLAASDVFVFPSYREGFPNVVIEAGAMELPSIVTDINGSREIIIEGENGIIIPSKNVNELYKAMEYMLTNEDVRRYMANKTRSLVASRYEQSFVRNCLKRYYKEILCCK